MATIESATEIRPFTVEVPEEDLDRTAAQGPRETPDPEFSPHRSSWD